MKPILVGAIITVIALLAAVYFTPVGNESESSPASAPAPAKSESFNLN